MASQKFITRCDAYLVASPAASANSLPSISTSSSSQPVSQQLGYNKSLRKSSPAIVVTSSEGDLDLGATEKMSSAPILPVLHPTAIPSAPSSSTFLMATSQENCFFVNKAEVIVFWTIKSSELQYIPIDCAASNIIDFNDNYIIVGHISGRISVYSKTKKTKLYDIFSPIISPPSPTSSHPPQSPTSASASENSLYNQLKFRTKQIVQISEEFLLVFHENGAVKLWSLEDKNQTKPMVRR